LEIAIQVDDRACLALERQGSVSLVPPAMWHSMGKLDRLARAGVDAATAQPHGQGPGSDSPLFVLQVMNVERRAFLMRRECTPKVKDQLTTVAALQKLQDLPGVAVFQSQDRWLPLRHTRFRFEGMPDARP
jgi:hypothetical protein